MCGTNERQRESCISSTHRLNSPPEPRLPPHQVPTQHRAQSNLQPNRTLSVHDRPTCRATCVPKLYPLCTNSAACQYRIAP